MVLAHEAHLEDVIAYADFSESVNVSLPVDESTLEEVPAESELMDLASGAVFFNSSQMHKVPNGKSENLFLWKQKLLLKKYPRN